MSVGERLNVILHEYAVLRDEQGRRFDAIDKMTNYIILVILGIAGVAVTLFEEYESNPVSLIVAVCLPLFFSPFVFGYLYNEFMIFRIGRYINRVLVQEIRKETKGALLGWDEFNVRETVRFFPLLTAFFRNLILVFPIGTPLFISVAVFPERPCWADILICIDGIILAIIIATIAYKGVYFLHVVDRNEKEKSG